VSAALRAVILTYGSGGEYVPLLRSLEAEGVERERILIVHNPSVAGQPAPAPAGIEVLRASHNLGYAAGMNLGIRRQLGRECDLVLILTHDARFRPGALRRLVAAADPRYGALGPALVHTGTDTPFSFGGSTHADGFLTHNDEPGRVEDGLSGCDWLDGGTMLVRAEALRRVGGFDERFWSYVEDADLCLRISRMGFGIAVVVDALADQDPGMSKRFGPWAYLVTRNRIAYAGRFAGRRGVARVGGQALYGAGLETVRALARLTRLREGPPIETWAVAVGTVRGIVAFLLRRWGPPPPGLPGGGDIGNIDLPAGQVDG
jgi:N-acetylglucosaminyl-diphospho-decaprenol L-rhamnosyltransferase